MPRTPPAGSNPADDRRRKARFLLNPCPIVLPMLCSSDLLARAQKILVGGVNSPVRAFRSVGATPLVHRPRRRLAPLGHRRPRISRLHLLLGRADSRPRASGNNRGRRRSSRAAARATASRRRSKSSWPSASPARSLRSNASASLAPAPKLPCPPSAPRAPSPDAI